MSPKPAKVITEIEAEARSADILREVEAGESYVVTSNGQPVARIMPLPGGEVVDREALRAEIWDRLASQPTLNLPRISRDEMHDD